MSHHRRAKADRKRLWIAEGYATALTVHHLTGETVIVALSSVSPPFSCGALPDKKHPACQIVLAADRDITETAGVKPLRPQRRL